MPPKKTDFRHATDQSPYDQTLQTQGFSPILNMSLEAFINLRRRHKEHLQSARRLETPNTTPSLTTDDIPIGGAYVDSLHVQASSVEKEEAMQKVRVMKTANEKWSQTAGAIDEENGKKIAKDLAALREEMAKGTTQLLKAIDSSNANAKNTAKECESLRVEFKKARIQGKELEGRRDSADAHVEKTTKSLRALQQELEKAKLKVKDAEHARDSASTDAKIIGTGLKELRAELEKESRAKRSLQMQNKTKKEQSPGPRAVFDFTCSPFGYVCVSENLFPISLTKNYTRVGVILAIIELIFTVGCLQNPLCDWIGKIVKKGIEILLYTAATLCWFLIYAVSSQNTSMKIMGC